MAWPPPPLPLSLGPSSSSDFIDDSPRRPSSAEFLKTAKERVKQQQQHPPLSYSSSMLLSPPNVKKGTTPTAEKRESAPPAFRIPASPTLSISDNGNSQPPKQRPRSGSYAQISPYLSTSTPRPLPALPTSRRPGSLTPDDSIKVPVDDDGLLHSPHTLNSDRLNSNGYHPQSPQFRPEDTGPGTSHHYTTGNQGNGVSSGTGGQGQHVLEHQSSMSSNGSGSSKSRPSMSSLRPSMSSLRPSSDLRGDTALDSGQTQEQVYRQKQGYGRSFGEGWPQHMSSNQQQHHPQHHPQHSSTSTRGSNDKPADERSTQQQHLTNLLQDEGAAKPRRASSPLESPAVSSSPATSSMISLPHTGQRLLNPGVHAVVAPTTSSSFSPTESATSRKVLKPTPTTTPHLSSQQLPNSNGLQPYYPPPPALSTNTRSNHSIESATSSPHSSTHSTDRMTVSPAPMLTATRSRRHSSSAGSLSIQTQHLDSFRKGPTTADFGGPLGRKNLKTSLATLPHSKQHSPSSSSAQLLPRQSPHHLGIPSPLPHPKQGQGSSSQMHGQYSQQHQQQQHHHPPPTPPSQQIHQQQQLQPQHVSYQHQHQLQQQRSTLRSQGHQQQHQHQHQHQHSTVRSSNSPRPTSPLGSGVLDTFQDRTAMALMQRYLTNPDDPESEADIQMQIMISQAAVDSKGFEVLVPQSVESIKRHHATLSSRIAALTARLSLESKIREAAQSLLKLHADNKKLARQASDHLEAANRKVDQVATELWKLTQLAADLQRTLLQHTSGVLALGVVRLEDQGRRERDVHALQLHEARVGKDVEEQFEAMSRTIMSLESDTLEAQSLLEDKDRTIDRLMKQLDHQRELYVRLDEQQQKMMVLSRSQQKNLDLLGGSRMNDAKTAAELEAFLAKVAGRLQGILQQQQQQQQQYRHQKQISTGTSARKVVTIDSERHQRQEEEEEDRNRSAQTWPSDLTLLSNGSASTQRSSTKMGPGREDSMSSSTRDGNSNLSTTVVSDRTATSSQESTIANNNNDDAAVITQHVSKERIFSTLDALDHFMTEAQQKSQILEEELGLLRRQSVALSESRNNSIKIKNFSSVRGQAAEDTIRSALEKSLKDALLEKEIARQELENERQRWQDDQNHRISALEESLVAVEDSDKLATGDTSSEVGTDGARSSQQDEETIRTLRQQLQEAIDEIDTLSQQQQSSLKSMRQLFDLIPDSRRKSHLQLFAAHQQQQRNGSTGGSESGRASPAGSVLSVSSVNAAVGFSMETLIARVRELVMRSQQLEQQQQQQDPSETNHPKAARSRQTSHQGSTLLPPNQDDLHHPQQNQDSTWISNSELERLQANAGMIQLLEKEIELLKQHTDMLLDENARLAEMAAATATSAPASRNTADLRAMISPPSKDDALDELHEIIRVKDTLLRERDEIVEQQEKALLQVRSELTLAVQANEEKKQQMSGGDEVSSSSSSSPPPLSSFDVVALEDFRVQCDKLEEQNGEMRMIIAALEAAHGGPGSGAQLLSTLQSTATNTPSSPTATGSWLTSRLGSAGSLSFGSLTQKLAPTPLPALEPTSSNSSNINTPIPSSVDAFSNSSSSHSPSSSSLQQPIGGGGGSHAAITSATAALRKEFRRVMTELREEKEKAVRKEVEERRRLERTVRQLRRELQAIQQ